MAKMGWTTERFGRDVTIGDLMEEIHRIDNAAEAKRFYDEYVQSIVLSAGENVEVAQDTARQNIGYVFGDGMAMDRRKMWTEACGAYHPWFPLGMPATPELAFEAGKRMGEKMRKAE